MNPVKSVKLWRSLFVVSASFLAVALIGGGIAYDQSAAINSAFKVKTYEVIKGDDEGEDTEYFKRQYTTPEALKEYTDSICRNLEQEGMVLLKNDNGALPLAEGNKISLFGQGSVSLNYGATGSSSTDTSGIIDLKTALSSFEVNPTLWDFYQTGAGSGYRRGKPGLIYKMNEAPWSAYSGVMSSFSQYNDAAVFVLSRDSGEGMDISTIGSDCEGGNYLNLHPNEREVLKQLTALKASGTFGKIVLLLNTPVPVQLDFLFDADINIDSALWIGNLGSTGAYAIDDVLSGKVSPSGKLSDTFLKDNFASPAAATWSLNKDKSFSLPYPNAADYPGFNNTQNTYAVYTEGIYVGYRYFETRYADKMMDSPRVGDFDYDAKVAYPFGHGLSYTDFFYSGFEMEEHEDHFLFHVDVMNIGGYKSKEAVQLYLQKPYTDYDREHGVEKAAVELVAFEKTGLLDTGDMETVTLRVEKEQLRSYDANFAKTYIVEEGDYHFAIGTNAHNALNNILDANGIVTDDYLVDPFLVATYHQDAMDKTTYSHSPINEDVEITNQFDFADINKYEGRGENHVTYASRNDWEGTFPKTSEILSITPTMEKDILSYKALPENDGKAMPAYGQDHGLSLITLRSTAEKPVSYDDPRWQDLLDQMSFAEQALLITDGQHNTSLVNSVNKPATKDENGPNGVSGSSTKASFPSEGIWASTFNKELLEEVGKCLAEDALAVGITGIYGPGVNLHRAPFGGRAHEYFSEDPYLMAICSVKETIGMQSKGVVTYVKHFVANDEETNRNGVSIWLNEQEMREIVLLPFEYSFRPDMGNAHATMTSFNRIGCLWTSASSALMENVLRDEWGFDGFAITDMASSNAKTFMTYVDGIANGTSLYDGAGSEKALDDYRGNVFFANKMREACHRILYVTANFSAAMNGISASDEIVPIVTWWQATIIGLRVGFGVLAGGTLVMLGVAVFLIRKEIA